MRGGGENVSRSTVPAAVALHTFTSLFPVTTELPNRIAAPAGLQARRRAGRVISTGTKQIGRAYINAPNLLRPEYLSRRSRFLGKRPRLYSRASRPPLIFVPTFIFPPRSASNDDVRPEDFGGFGAVKDATLK